jgi:hypothetical protein
VSDSRIQFGSNESKLVPTGLDPGTPKSTAALKKGCKNGRIWMNKMDDSHDWVKP